MSPSFAVVGALFALAASAGVQGPAGRRIVFVDPPPTSVRVHVGDDLELSCAAAFDPDASPPGPDELEAVLRKVKMRWLRDNATVGNTARTLVSKTVAGGVASARLTVRRVDASSAGFYSCLAADGKRKIRSDAAVTVSERAQRTTTTSTSTSAPTTRDESTSTAAPTIAEFALEDQPPCQPYLGDTCATFLRNESVFVAPPATHALVEQKLKIAFGVISHSNEISPNCEKYALPSVCFSTFPICKTPELTNELYFESLRDARSARRNAIRKQRTRRDLEYRVDARTKKASGSIDRAFGFSLDRDSTPLRRVCRDDCELLEDELCQKEYAIAKRHPEIGLKLKLEECSRLPSDDDDCLRIGIERRVNPADECYWENGLGYEGVVDSAATGEPCVKWSHQFKFKISDHLELLGHAYCRNPGAVESRPWCFVEAGNKIERRPCDVPKCSQRIWIYIVSSMVLFGALIASCLICAFCRHRNSKNDTAAIRNINLPNADKNIYGDSRLNSPIELTDLLAGRNGPNAAGGSRASKILRVPQYELSQITFVEELGEGAFGKVYKGELMRDGDSVFVAVKALKENASPKTQSDFKREIELISELRHENIVCILGVVLREEPLCMLFEFMAKGDLHEFLVGRAPPDGAKLTPMQFLSISHHIASGMEYLAAHHYVHRDLAARNCLVADNLVVKISDFGLSRDIYSSDYYRVQSKSLLPVRWMPPESILYGKFTTESDVWSYGIVLWEIYSYGLQPYYGYSNQEVISMVRGRELLQCPAECPRAVYILMRDCWHQTAVKRPNFTTICHRLTELKLSLSGIHTDNTSESSSAVSGPRAPMSLGDPKERIPLISHHSSSNGSLTGSIPRKLSTADSIKSHTSARLMVSSSDVTSGSDNCDNSVKIKKSSFSSLVDGQTSNSNAERQRDTVVKISSNNQPYAF